VLCNLGQYISDSAGQPHYAILHIIFIVGPLFQMSWARTCTC